METPAKRAHCFSILFLVMLVLGIWLQLEHAAHAQGNDPRQSFATEPVGILAEDGWIVQTVDSSSPAGPPLSHPSLVLDKNDNPSISYSYPQEGKSPLKYARKMGGVWDEQIVDDVISGRSSLALDSEDNPHISYLILSKNI